MKIELLAKIFNFNEYNRERWLARKAKAIPAGSRVLDAGAGRGRYRHLFAHCDYKTQDFCQEPSTAGDYTKMDYVCDITKIPVPDESFDVVVCTEVLEHLPEPIKAIEEFRRILRNGRGQLLISAPLGCGLHQKPYIFHGGYTPFWYERSLAMFGFTDLEVLPNGGFFRHYGQESQRFITYLFPEDRKPIVRILTFPIKVILALWFRLLMPVLCYFLDSLDKDQNFTVGYFVQARVEEQ